MPETEPKPQADGVQTSKQEPQTLLLFTLSDLKTFVIPESAFGLFAALSGPVMTTNKSPNLLSTVSRTPHVLLWTWLNTLLFTLSNQRLPDAIKEDAISKPSRPLPSARITISGATRLLLLETVLLTCLNWMYNELGGSDDYIGRSILLAATYACYCAGSVQVASGPEYTMHRAAYQWIAIIAGVIFTTMHVQDFKDQEGDSARGRKTLPLVLGDRPARWTVAIPVLVWSILCPTFWSLQAYSFATTMMLGLGVAVRVIWRRGVDADRFTWKLWCLWLTVLYMLPVFKNHGFISRFWAVGTI
ncbi:hypothetical protein BDR22DRAFT_898865 [Usnea florida]